MEISNGIKGWCNIKTGCLDPHPTVDTLIRSRQCQLNEEDVCVFWVHIAKTYFFKTIYTVHKKENI